MPPTSPEITLPRPSEIQILDGETRRAALPKYSWARSSTATTAFPNVRGNCGITNNQNAVPKAAAGGSPMEGTRIDGPSRLGWAATTVAAMPATRTASAAQYRPSRTAHHTPKSVAAARSIGHGDAGTPEKTAGGFTTSFHAAIPSRIPTPSWSDRMTGLVKIRA